MPQPMREGLGLEKVQDFGFRGWILRFMALSGLGARIDVEKRFGKRVYG
jgi:hypothetical protein